MIGVAVGEGNYADFLGRVTCMGQASAQVASGFVDTKGRKTCIKENGLFTNSNDCWGVTTFKAIRRKIISRGNLCNLFVSLVQRKRGIDWLANMRAVLNCGHHCLAQSEAMDF